MTEAAYEALESLGSAKTRDVGSRDSWAMIGVKGAPVGSVPELHVTRFNGFAEVEQAAPAVHLVDGFHFYYADHLGSTRMLDDWESGVADMEVDYYYPYGEINQQGGGGEDTRYKFTSQEEDSEIGLHYFRARFYNPAIGRFLTPDPAGQTFSPYAYVGNRPLDFVDPDGRMGLPFGDPFGTYGNGGIGISFPIWGNPGVTDVTGIGLPGSLPGGTWADRIILDPKTGEIIEILKFRWWNPFTWKYRGDQFVWAGYEDKVFNEPVVERQKYVDPSMARDAIQSIDYFVAKDLTQALDIAAVLTVKYPFSSKLLSGVSAGVTFVEGSDLDAFVSATTLTGSLASGTSTGAILFSGLQLSYDYFGSEGNPVSNDVRGGGEAVADNTRTNTVPARQSFFWYEARQTAKH